MGVSAMTTLGATIKKLRKERKMTQSDVAGDQMTKGMLSLIENDKAQPSMENLKYIATKLKVDVSQLLGENQNQEELRELLRTVEMMLQNRLTADKKAVLDTLLPHVSKFETLTTFEEIRLFDLYSQMQALVNDQFDEQLFLTLSEKYEAIGLHDYMIHCYFTMMGYNFLLTNYERAIDYIMAATEKFEQYYLVISNPVKLDFYYNKMIATTARNIAYNWKEDAEKALSLSKETNLYYRMNDFYRFLFIQALEERNGPLAQHYLHKLRLYSELAELKMDRVAVQLFTLSYELFINDDLDKALNIHLEIDDELKDIFDFDITYESLLCYIYFRKCDYETCYRHWQKLRMPDQMAHPLDRLIIYFGAAAGAASAYELGHITEAKKEILFILNEIKDYPKMTYTAFIEEIAEKILH